MPSSLTAPACSSAVQAAARGWGSWRARAGRRWSAVEVQLHRTPPVGPPRPGGLAPSGAVPAAPGAVSGASGYQSPTLVRVGCASQPPWPSESRRVLQHRGGTTTSGNTVRGARRALQACAGTGRSGTYRTTIMLWPKSRRLKPTCSMMEGVHELYRRAYLWCILTSLSLLGRNKPPLSTLQWAAAHRGSKASKARGRRYTRSQRTPPSLEHRNQNACQDA